MNDLPTLTISRCKDQSVRIGESIVTVASSAKGKVRLRISAPSHIKILRTELETAGDAMATPSTREAAHA